MSADRGTYYLELIKGPPVPAEPLTVEEYRDLTLAAIDRCEETTRFEFHASL